MKNKKVYRVRRKGTDHFISLGYNNKSSWSVYPSAAIKESTAILNNKDQFEIVTYEFELKEIKTEELR